MQLGSRYDEYEGIRCLVREGSEFPAEFSD